MHSIAAASTATGFAASGVGTGEGPGSWSGSTHKPRGMGQTWGGQGPAAGHQSRWQAGSRHSRGLRQAIIGGQGRAMGIWHGHSYGYLHFCTCKCTCTWVWATCTCACWALGIGRIQNRIQIQMEYKTGKPGPDRLCPGLCPTHLVLLRL